MHSSTPRNDLKQQLTAALQPCSAKPHTISVRPPHGGVTNCHANCQLLHEIRMGPPAQLRSTPAPHADVWHMETLPGNRHHLPPHQNSHGTKIVAAGARTPLSPMHRNLARAGPCAHPCVHPHRYAGSELHPRTQPHRANASMAAEERCNLPRVLHSCGDALDGDDEGILECL